MEQLELVCERTGRALGVAVPRAAAIAAGAWCRSTNIFVMNHKGEILCHQRSLKKERHPGVWSTHLGGHVGHGETFETNAAKELEEEAGLAPNAAALIPWRTTKMPASKLWVREFVAVIDAPVEAFTPQPGEVERFAWKSVDDIIRESEFEPHMWLAGTHDFRSEYMCLRAVVTAMSSLGTVEAPEDMHTWHMVERAA